VPHLLLQLDRMLYVVLPEHAVETHLRAGPGNPVQAVPAVRAIGSSGRVVTAGRLPDDRPAPQLSRCRSCGTSQSAWKGATGIRQSPSLTKLGLGPAPNRATEAKSVVCRNAGSW